VRPSAVPDGRSDGQVDALGWQTAAEQLHSGPHHSLPRSCSLSACDISTCYTARRLTTSSVIHSRCSYANSAVDGDSSRHWCSIRNGRVTYPADTHWTSRDDYSGDEIIASGINTPTNQPTTDAHQSRPCVSVCVCVCPAGELYPFPIGRTSFIKLVVLDE